MGSCLGTLRSSSCATPERNSDVRGDDIFPVGRLSVSILRAEGIETHPFRPNGETTKAYAILKFGVQEKRTTTYHGVGSNLQWHQVFTFDIPEQHDQYKRLEIVIYNHLSSEQESDQVVGRYVFTNLCHDLRREGNGIPERWYTVSNEDGLRGQISVALSFEPAEDGKWSEIASRVLNAVALPVAVTTGHVLSVAILAAVHSLAS